MSLYNFNSRNRQYYSNAAKTYSEDQYYEAFTSGGREGNDGDGSLVRSSTAGELNQTVHEPLQVGKRSRKAKLEVAKIQHDNSMNPLMVFPAKSTEISGSFFKPSVPKRYRQLESITHWLKPDKIDPNFGITGNSQEALIRRAYRRIGSSQLFLQPDPRGPNADLSQLNNPAPHTIEINDRIINEKVNKKLVLVGKDHLGDLLSVERILSDEREKLGLQCAMTLGTAEHDGNIELHAPVPATRLAMHNICETDMREVAKRITYLSKQWAAFVQVEHLSSLL